MSFRSFLKSRLFVRHFLLATVTVIVVLYGSFTLLNMYTLHDDHVEVPDFKGLYIKDLKNFVQGHELKFEIVDSIYNMKLAKGTVIDQDPAPGSTVKQGRTVYLTVNAILNQTVPMPDLVDLSLRQATSLLETYGLKVGSLKYIAGLPPVINQLYNGRDIKAGTIISKGSSIDLVLGKGADTGLIKVPDLFGLNITDARAVLAGRQLKLGTRLPDASGFDTLTARIYRQNPPVDVEEGLYAGAEIDVWLTGKQEVLDAERTKKDTIE